MNGQINLHILDEDCSGCSACVVVCPYGAISMQPDGHGFFYPEIAQEKCIQCGACLESCDFKKRNDLASASSRSYHLPLVYAVKHSNEAKRMSSQSGGAFTALAEYILARGGIVYGAGYGEDFRVIHKRVTNLEQLEELKGSKYVQSDTSEIFAEVMSDLKAGKEVLFSGTPCQIAGVSCIKDKSKLYLCDLVCHGVPSPKIWQDFLSFRQAEHGGNITAVNFRDKSFKWQSHVETIQFSDGSKVSGTIYRDLFYEHLGLRPSCFDCKYASFNRISDLTIGDFWGIEKAVPGFQDEKGVSLLLVNTEKGTRLWDAVKPQMEFRESTPAGAAQPRLRGELAERPENYNEFWADYLAKGFSYVCEKYIGEDWDRVYQ